MATVGYIGVIFLVMSNTLALTDIAWNGVDPIPEKMESVQEPATNKIWIDMVEIYADQKKAYKVNLSTSGNITFETNKIINKRDHLFLGPSIKMDKINKTDVKAAIQIADVNFEAKMSDAPKSKQAATMAFNIPNDIIKRFNKISRDSDDGDENDAFEEDDSKDEEEDSDDIEDTFVFRGIKSMPRKSLVPNRAYLADNIKPSYAKSGPRLKYSNAPQISFRLPIRLMPQSKDPIKPINNPKTSNYYSGYDQYKFADRVPRQSYAKFQHGHLSLTPEMQSDQRKNFVEPREGAKIMPGSNYGYRHPYNQIPSQILPSSRMQDYMIDQRPRVNQGRTNNRYNRMFQPYPRYPALNFNHEIPMPPYKYQPNDEHSMQIILPIPPTNPLAGISRPDYPYPPRTSDNGLPFSHRLLNRVPHNINYWGNNNQAYGVPAIVERQFPMARPTLIQNERAYFDQQYQDNFPNTINHQPAQTINLGDIYDRRIIPSAISKSYPNYVKDQRMAQFLKKLLGLIRRENGDHIYPSN